MTKMRSLNVDRVATNYLVGLCRIARDFQIDKNSDYANNHAYLDDFWIERLNEQSRQTNELCSKINELRIKRAMSVFDSSKSWLTNVKLGLADNLVAVQSLVHDYDMTASNHFQFKISMGAEARCHQYPFIKRKYVKPYDTCSEEAIYDELLAEIIGIYQSTEKELDMLHRDIICKAYMNMALRKLDETREQIRAGSYLLPYVQLRQIIKPVRRPNGADSFQYRLTLIEERVGRLISELNAKLNEVDVAYTEALREQKALRA